MKSERPLKTRRRKLSRNAGTTTQQAHHHGGEKELCIERGEVGRLWGLSPPPAIDQCGRATKRSGEHES